MEGKGPARETQMPGIISLKVSLLIALQLTFRSSKGWSQLQLSTEVPTSGISMWFRLPTGWNLDSKRRSDTENSKRSKQVVSLQTQPQKTCNINSVKISELQMSTYAQVRLRRRLIISHLLMGRGP